MISTKPHYHHTEGEILYRERLVRKIGAAQRKSKYLFLSAPGGYGKTVAASQSLGSSLVHPAWITLDAEDNEPALFFNRFGLAASLARGGRIKTEAKNIYTLDTLLDMLRSMTPCRYKSHLVLDDLHMLQNGELQAVLPLLLEALPKGLSVMLLSRHAHPASLQPFMDQGSLVSLGADALRFTREEVQELFEHAGKEVDAETLDRVLQRTEGWAISLGAELISGTHGKSASLQQYLDDYVWPTWEDKTKLFLLRCSVAKELTPALCQAITEETDADETLGKLVKQGAFLAETEKGHYRLHDLFHDYLLDRAQKDLDRQTEERARRTYADWLMVQKDYYTALREYTLLLDTEGINSCLQTISDFSIPQAVESEINFAKQHVTGKLSDSFIEQNPYLLEMMPWVHFLDGDAAGFTSWMDKIGELLPGFMEEYPTLAETAVFMGSLDFRMPLQKIAQFAASQMELMPPIQEEDKKAKSSSLTQNLPYFHRSMRDYSEYHLLEDSELSLLRATFGRLIGPEYPVYEHCLIGGVQYEQNHLLDACRNALEACHKCGDNAGPETVFAAQMLLAAVLDSMGSKQYAQAMYDEAAKSIAQGSADYLSANLRAVRTRRLIRQGDADAATEWLRYFATDETAGEHLAYYRLPRHFTTLEALAATGRWERADRFAQRLYQLGKTYCRPLDMLETEILHCGVFERSGNPEKAEDMLLRALNRAQEFGFRRMFTENGDRILPVLNRILDSSGQTREVHSFSLALHREILDSQGATQAMPILTVRQTEMLTELQAGGSYADIAARTSLSKSSVKTHLVRLYKTLEVHNAQQAVEKAKMLGLI